MEQFPIKPFLDRVIVREIPVAEYFRVDEQSRHIALDNANIQVPSDRGVVVAVGDGVPMGGVIMPMPVKPGDTVRFDAEFKYDPIYLNPADKYRDDLPKYWQIRVGDLKGVEVDALYSALRGDLTDAVNA